MSPSQESLTASSRKAWISSMDVASMFLANANSSLTSVKLSRNNCLRSWKGCCNKDYPTSDLILKKRGRSVLGRLER